MQAPRSRTELTVHSFDDVSRFLRSGMADEESRQLRESVGALAQQIDEAVRLRRAPAAGADPGHRSDEAAIARCAARLAQRVAEHQRFLTGLGSAWHGLYEMGAYQNALRGLRRAVNAWHNALLQRSADEGEAYAHLEPLAWRTLGEGLLLIDMYEQGGGVQSEPNSPPAALRKPAGFLERSVRWLRSLGSRS